MNGLTTWKRIEPHARTMDLTPGLAAEIADPLWMLLRQWQLGELTGDDGGAPVAVDVATSWSRFSRFRAEGITPETANSPGPEAFAIPRTGEGVLLREHDGPLERLVEREPVLGGLGGGVDPDHPAPWVAAVQTGRSFRRHLEAAGLGGVVQRLMACAPETTFQTLAAKDAVADPQGARFRTLLAGKVLDGAQVLALVDGPGLPAEAIGDADAGKVADLVALWRTEVEEDWGTGNATAPSWVSNRLEYAFSVGAPPLPVDGYSDPPGGGGEIVLRAVEYDGAGLSWHSLDIDPDPVASLGAAADGGGPHEGDESGEGYTGRQVRSMLAAPLRYPGMPADRYWEFEDSKVSFGNASAGPTDLARLMAVDYAVVYSPDWFIVPVELPVGCVARVDWVVVRDTFGVATLVGTSRQQSQDAAGRMFQPVTAGGHGVEDVPLLVVLPSALGSASSAPLEDVALQRDEAANVAWSIESRVLGPSGLGVDTPWFRSEFALGPVKTADPYDLVWRLATRVAQSWIPLVAVSKDEDAQPVLRKARLLETDKEGLLATEIGQTRSAKSLIMREVRDVCDEEITCSGINVRVVDQIARGYDGQSYLWRGRTKQAWKGEASSGLRFDAVTSKPKA